MALIFSMLFIGIGKALFDMAYTADVTTNAGTIIIKESDLPSIEDYMRPSYEDLSSSTIVHYEYKEDELQRQIREED